MTECTPQIELFSIGKRRVTVASDGRMTSSDAGVLAMGRIEKRLGLASRLSEVLVDPRDPSRVIHSYEDQLRQRILQIVCGYEDADDADTLRHDAAFQTAMGRVPGTVSAALASQPTLSRFEKRSAEEVEAISSALIDLWIERLERKGPKAWRNIVLDFDSTDDPTHGAQQLSMFHGYYDQYMYHPLLVFDGEGWPVAVVLRPGRAHASDQAVEVLLRIMEQIAERLPRSARVTFRADAGFAIPELYTMCETLGIDYVIGQITHQIYKTRAEKLMARARKQFDRTGEKARLFGQFHHRAGTWDRSRRIIAKAEALKEGDNPRFIITNRAGTPEENYTYYTQRGQSENHIKDLKNAMFADRLSCTKFDSNFFRLLLHTAAYIVMFELREQLAGTELARAQMDTLRLRLIKIGVTITVTARRIWIHLSRFHPSMPLLMDLVAQLARAPG
jgi:Transposase DDE domain group 1